jgi:hypothetical protein
MTTSTAPFAFTPYTPLATAPVLAIQFLGQLDPESESPAALAFAHTANPARTPDLSLTGTFAGFPVREEPYRHTPQATIPAPVAATLHLAPATELAVLVPTAAGGHPAFSGDWIVQAADSTYSVWSDLKFRAGFDVPEAPGSGTGRYGAGEHWTQHGDGTDYPSEGGSFGVPQNTPVAEPAAAAFAPSGTIGVGSSFRILRGDQSVDPAVHVVKALDFGLVSYEADGETLEVSRDHVVPVKAEHDILA